MERITDSQILVLLELYQHGISPTCRNASFDFCYGYFLKNRGNKLLGDNLEKSCYVLWSYLSSWGMLRGSSYIQQFKNPSFLKPVIEYIAKADNDFLFDIDVDTYNQNNIECIINTYNDLERLLTCEQGHPTITLITKIMLGVWANIPAFDTNFVRTFKHYNGCSFTRVNRESLSSINRFYNNHKECIDNQTYKLFDFSGDVTEVTYSKAKIIDMIGWQNYFTSKTGTEPFTGLSIPSKG